MSKYESAEYQRKVKDFVSREVYYCASELIWEMAQKPEYMDDLMEVCVRYPEITDGTVYRYIIKLDERGEFYATLYLVDSEDPEEERAIWEIHTEEAYQLAEDGIDFHDCESVADEYASRQSTPSHGDYFLDASDDVPLAEGDPEEALEHWIVSDWLARELSERGEMVGDFLGLTIWGRTTTGQSIALDQVICDIYDSIA